MNINITSFNKINVIDSCSIWNILSCNLFYSRCLDNKFFFSLTRFVEYECLFKPRTTPSKEDELIKSKLNHEIKKGKFLCHALSIEDIQDAEILNSRKNLGMGELSSIAFAKKINQCFLTDDQPARIFAATILGKDKVQTTPHLLGYLFHERIVTDSELDEIILDHKKSNRPLEKYFREVHIEALRIRSLHKR